MLLVICPGFRWENLFSQQLIKGGISVPYQGFWSSSHPPSAEAMSICFSWHRPLVRDMTIYK